MVWRKSPKVCKKKKNSLLTPQSFRTQSKVSTKLWGRKASTGLWLWVNRIRIPSNTAYPTNLVKVFFALGIEKVYNLQPGLVKGKKSTKLLHRFASPLPPTTFAPFSPRALNPHSAHPSRSSRPALCSALWQMLFVSYRSYRKGSQQLNQLVEGEASEKLYIYIMFVDVHSCSSIILARLGIPESCLLEIFFTDSFGSQTPQWKYHKSVSLSNVSSDSNQLWMSCWPPGVTQTDIVISCIFVWSKKQKVKACFGLLTSVKRPSCCFLSPPQKKKQTASCFST